MPTYPIETARLHLRLFEPGDLDDLFEYMSRPDVVRYLYGGVKDRAESDAILRRWMSASTLAH
jgi:RimJ/RimL family protein N-acetyltransferase